MVKFFQTKVLTVSLKELNVKTSKGSNAQLEKQKTKMNTNNSVNAVNVVNTAIVGSDTAVGNSPSVTSIKRVGRPKSVFTRDVIFTRNASGEVIRRGRGKPGHASQALIYRISVDYTGQTLPEGAEFVGNALVKDTRKPKVADSIIAPVTVPA